MRASRLVPLAALLLSLCATPSLAQDESNPDVIPAPDVLGKGVLLYPGGQYGRITHPLLQPGEPYPGTRSGVIHLHMPRKQVAKKATPAAAPAPTAVASVDSNATSSASAPLATTTPTVADAAPTPAPAVVKHPRVAKPVKTASAPPPPASSSTDALNFTASAVPFSFGPTAGSLASSPPSRPSPPPRPSQPPARVAKANPPPAETFTTETAAPSSPALGAGLAKQTQIIFAANAPDPSPDSIDAIKGLAGPLNSALVSGASRIQIVAYGGAAGDKSSDARRLSLRRARIIRQLLIDGGVPAERIDVRAMGGASDGTPDRVDIFTKA